MTSKDLPCGCHYITSNGVVYAVSYHIVEDLEVSTFIKDDRKFVTIHGKEFFVDDLMNKYFRDLI